MKPTDEQLTKAIWDAMDDRCTTPCWAEGGTVDGCGCIQTAAMVVKALMQVPSGKEAKDA